MLIKARLFEHYNNYDFNIPLEGGESIFVKKDQKIDPGDLIIVRTENRIKDSYFLVDELGCNTSQCQKYLSCIDGSYIRKGELIAEKKSKNGLSVKQVLAKDEGVIDLERLEKGFVDILSEEEKNEIESKFSGIIKEILPGSHISINSPASALDLVGTTKFTESVFGEIVFISKDDQLPSEIPDINLKNKIVWVGSYLPHSLALTIFRRGALAILTYSMEYDDFKKTRLPIAVIEGFGKIYCDQKFVTEIFKLENRFAIIDGNENQLFVAKEQQTGEQSKEYFVKELLGAYVISRHSAHYGYIGVITAVNDLNYVTVDFGNSGKSIVDIGSLDFITL